MPNEKKIAYFSENNIHTSTAYFHVYIFKIPLKKFGINLEIYPILPNFLFRIWSRCKNRISLRAKGIRFLLEQFVIPAYRIWQICKATANGADGYAMGRCLLKLHGNPWLERGIGWIARLRKVPFILFYPDALHLKISAPYAVRFKAVSHVISVTPWLANSVRSLGYSSGCVRASIVTARYPISKQCASSLVTLGFSGGPGNLSALLALEPVLAAVANHRSATRIKIVGKSPPPFRLKFSFLFERWGNDDPFSTPYEPGVAEMLDFTIGLAPIVEDEYAMGKDSVKLRQYMALGLAIVGSDFGVNHEIIKHGVNGLLAKTQDDWISNIILLIDQPELRSRLGTEARANVVKQFDASVQVSLLKDEILNAIRIAKTPIL